MRVPIARSISAIAVGIIALSIQVPHATAQDAAPPKACCAAAKAGSAKDCKLDAKECKAKMPECKAKGTECKTDAAGCIHALGSEAAAPSNANPQTTKLTKQCCIDAVKAGKKPCCVKPEATDAG